MEKLITCTGCGERKAPAVRDAVFCKACWDDIASAIDARAEELRNDPEQSRAVADAVFATVRRSYEAHGIKEWAR